MDSTTLDLLNGATARIVLRYFAMRLIATGKLPVDLGNTIMSDPDVVRLLGAIIAGSVEGFYVLAKKKRWKL